MVIKSDVVKENDRWLYILKIYISKIISKPCCSSHCFFVGGGGCFLFCFVFHFYDLQVMPSKTTVRCSLRTAL